MKTDKIGFAAVAVLGVSSFVQAAYFNIIDQAVEVRSCIRIGDYQGHALAQDSYSTQAEGLAQYKAAKYVAENPQDACGGQAFASVSSFAQIDTQSYQQIGLSTSAWQEYSVSLCDTIDYSTCTVYARAKAWVLFDIQDVQGALNVTAQTRWGDHGIYQSGLINLFDITVNQHVYFNSPAGLIGPDAPLLDQTAGTANLSAGHLYLLTCTAEPDLSGLSSGPMHETALTLAPSQMVIPEPATISILLLGVSAIAWDKKRRISIM